MIGAGSLAGTRLSRLEIDLFAIAGVGGYMAETNTSSLATLPVREEFTTNLPEGTMAHGALLALRRAHLRALTQLAGYLRQTLSPAERELWLRIRQARLIELGAVEEYLALPRTVLPRRKRKKTVDCRWEKER